jgi:hypothetical protein
VSEEGLKKLIQDAHEAVERGKRLNDSEDVEPFFKWAHRVDQWIYNDLPLVERALAQGAAELEAVRRFGPTLQDGAPRKPENNHLFCRDHPAPFGVSHEEWIATAWRNGRYMPDREAPCG